MQAQININDYIIFTLVKQVSKQLHWSPPYCMYTSNLFCKSELEKNYT